MVPLRPLRPSLAAACILALLGCPAAPMNGPTLPVVDRAGTPAPLTPGKEAPDEAMLSLARTGLAAANALGPAVRAFVPVIDAVRASRAKHPPAAYRLAQVSGWRFLGGAWLQAEADGSRSLRATIEDLTGKTPGWDVTVEANYGPDFHSTFPGEAVRLRLDVDQALPTGGRMTAAFVGPVGQAGEALELTGVGSVVVLGAAGAVSFEALNARLGAGGTVERGDVVLKSLGTGSTLQFTGTWAQGGLQGATLLKSATPAGTVVQAGGRWQITNEAGSYPL